MPVGSFVLMEREWPFLMRGAAHAPFRVDVVLYRWVVRWFMSVISVMNEGFLEEANFLRIIEFGDVGGKLQKGRFD